MANQDGSDALQGEGSMELHLLKMKQRIISLAANVESCEISGVELLASGIQCSAVNGHSGCGTT